jgi:single-stranded-DNA-specific exonuclease
MKKQWIVQKIDEGVKLVDSGLPELIRRLLILRGLTTSESVAEFLAPDYANLNDPFLFKDMDKSVVRIFSALEKHEKIVIYADYDADAITACAVMILGLRKLGGNVEYYIPDRFLEGYGLNTEAIRKICQEGAQLIITVDCGINAVAEAMLAKELGVDMIITDHHELTSELPQAFAVVNPKNPADNYPFLYLTGVGVAFKVVQALFSGKEKLEASGILAGWEKWLLDLVAIGTVADCQSLTLENRILVSFGLRVLPKSRWPGLKALIEVAGINNRFDAYTLGFALAPRINAAGRIKHANIALKLLITDNTDEAKELAGELNNLNLHRQTLTEQILSEARMQIEMLGDKKVLLVAGSNWPKGIIGLVAGKLAEEFGRPTLVLEKGESVATGSGRSVNDFNLVEGLGFAKDFLERFGGHHQAAGFSVKNTNIDSFYGKILEYAETVLPEKALGPVLQIDAEVRDADLTWDIFEYIQKFAPFGVGNYKPRFVAIGLTLRDFRLVGVNSQHLKLRLNVGEKIFDAIAFGQGFFAHKLTPGKKLDAIFELDSNEWNGQKDLQLKIIDLKISEE